MNIPDAGELDRIDFEKGDGLVPVVAQHAHTGEVLMLAYADRSALERSLESGEMWYWSRSRGRLWHKGETSGNVQRLVSLDADCDRDAILARVEPAGPACHTGARNCFDAAPPLGALAAVLEDRLEARPEGSYTVKLLEDRNLRLKKLGEEAVEVAVACADADADRAAEEAADLIYHLLVACTAAGSSTDGILAALERRLPGR